VEVSRVGKNRAAPARPARLRPAPRTRRRAAQGRLKIIINAKGPLGKRMRWVAVYERFEPVHTSPDGTRHAGFTDIQESGPFKSWRHSHEMTAIDANTTRLLDTIDYEVPLGFLGNIANTLFVKGQLDAMFKHRHAVTLREMQS